MLNVIGFLSVEHTTLEVDDYVPIQFRCLDYIDAAPLYWRTGDFDNQLLEIGLDSHSGAICKVTLTGFGNPISETDEEEYQAIAGVPVCDTSMWASAGRSDYETRFRDSPSTYKITVGKGSIRLDLYPALIVTTWFVAGRVYFGIDNRNNLISITFAQMSDAEMQIIDLHWK